MFSIKRIIFFAILSFHGIFVIAQTDSTVSKYFIAASANYGFIIAHDPNMVNLQTGHTRSADIVFCRHSNPDNRWGKDYNYPDCGFGVSFYDLQSPKYLGDAGSVFVCSYFPILGTTKLNWTFRIAYGLGYIQKPFNRTENYKNSAIGSHFNGFMQLTNSLAYRFDKNNKLLFGISFSHYSNGSFRVPNLGINIPAFQLSYGRYFGTQKLKSDAASKPYLPKKWQHYAYGSFALKEISPINGPKYTVYTLGYENVKYTSKKCGFGSGAEIIYDSSLRQLILNTRKKDPGSDAANFVIGMYGRFALRMGNLEADADVGFYPYTTYKDYGYIYSKFGFRRYFGDKYYISFDLKTHFFVADYFELSAGVKI